MLSWYHFLKPYTITSLVIALCLFSDPLWAKQPLNDLAKKPVKSAVLEDIPHSITLHDYAELLDEAQKRQLTAVMYPLTAYDNVAFLSIDKDSQSSDAVAYKFARSVFEKRPGIVLVIDLSRNNISVIALGKTQSILSEEVLRTVTINNLEWAQERNYYRCAERIFQDIETLLRIGTISKQAKKRLNTIYLAPSDPKGKRHD